MHTEHLQNVRPSWVAFGWFVSAAMTSLVLFGMIALRLLGPEGGSLWVALAIFAGFLAGGYFLGARVGLAPILHAVAIGLFSVVVWLLANLLFGEPLGQTTWDALSPTFVAGIFLLQIVAAALGARLASRDARAAAATGAGS